MLFQSYSKTYSSVDQSPRIGTRQSPAHVATQLKHTRPLASSTYSSTWLSSFYLCLYYGACNYPSPKRSPSRQYSELDSCMRREAVSSSRADKCLRICVISAIRVVSLARWDFSDISWGMWKVAVWSTLEPTLGIINCCLPVLNPVAETVHSSAMWAKCIGKKSSTPQGRTSHHKALYRDGGENDVETGRFKRLADHSFPLENISGTTYDDSSPNFREP